jgi:putative inorganic carbon (HCO3(-)) transporter
MPEEGSMDAPSRPELWTIAWQVFADRPFLGVGFNNLRWHYSTYAGVEQFVSHAHSLIFGLLAETGILGLAAFLWFLAVLAQIAWRGRHKVQLSGALWMWWLALLASLLAWFVHGLVDFPFSSLSPCIAFWLVAGLLVSASERAGAWGGSDDT